MLLEGMILKSSLQFNKNRTCSAIYHLISGKRSIQTVQDAHIYQLKKFYGINRSLDKHDFNKVMNRLAAAQLLEIDKEMNCSITSSGVNWLNKNEHELKLYEFEGILYHAVSAVFYERLLLLVQTLSNSCNNNYSFIPVVEKISVINFVKMVFKQMGKDKKTYFNKLYGELHQLLHSFSDTEASIYVDRLSGYNLYGKSKDQLLRIYQKDKWDIPFIIERMNHKILNEVYLEPDKYSAMCLMIKDLNSQQFITNSASKTYQLLQQNRSISEIVSMRRIKENTVFDHIVEIALFTNHFPISNYVPEPYQQQIMQAVRKDKRYKLKTIKEMVDSEISYFQIRLVLATMKHEGELNE